MVHEVGDVREADRLDRADRARHVLRVVEHVQRLCLKFERRMFGEVEALHRRQIEVVDVRQGDVLRAVLASAPCVRLDVLRGRVVGQVSHRVSGGV